MLYLELGVVPLRYIIMSRRIMFYHSMIREPDTSLLYKFYMAQSKNPSTNDWCLTVQADLAKLKIEKTESEIKKLSDYRFRKIVNTAISKECVLYLERLKNSHSKVLHLSYNLLKMQVYLLPNQIPTQLSKFAFACKTRMVPVGANFKAGNRNPRCPLCKTEYASQSHLLECTMLVSDNTVCKDVIKYDDLFSNNLAKMMTVVRQIYENLKKRQNIIKKS